MPRRIHEYPVAYSFWNALSSYGSLISFVSSIFFVYIILLVFEYEEKLEDLNEYYSFRHFTDIRLFDIDYISNGQFIVCCFKYYK